MLTAFYAFLRMQDFTESFFDGIKHHLLKTALLGKLQALRMTTADEESSINAKVR